MIGDKRLKMPKDWDNIVEIFDYFGLRVGGEDQDDDDNACRLVELNNEVYDSRMKEIKESLEPLYCGNDD